MDELEAFRSQVRSWLSARFAPRDPNRDDDRVDIISRAPAGHRALIDRAVSLQRELYAAGFAAVSAPLEYGGRGLTSAHEDVVGEELAAVDSPSLRPLSIGTGLVSPTLRAAGTEEQKRRFLPPLFSGQEVWCQLFTTATSSGRSTGAGRWPPERCRVSVAAIWADRVAAAVAVRPNRRWRGPGAAPTRSPASGSST